MQARNPVHRRQDHAKALLADGSDTRNAVSLVIRGVAFRRAGVYDCSLRRFPSDWSFLFEVEVGCCVCSTLIGCLGDLRRSMRTSVPNGLPFQSVRPDPLNHWIRSDRGWRRIRNNCAPGISDSTVAMTIFPLPYHFKMPKSISDLFLRSVEERPQLRLRFLPSIITLVVSEMFAAIWLYFQSKRRG